MNKKLSLPIQRGVKKRFHHRGAEITEKKRGDFFEFLFVL